MGVGPAPDAVIFFCGETSFQDCLESVRGQTLPPGRVHVIQDVYPQGLASKQGHEEMVRQGSRTYVSVDADMILHPHCFETLSAALEARADNCYAVAARLEDGIEGPVFGIKIFQTRVVADLGGFREVAGVFRDFDKRAGGRGWTSICIDDVVGLHNPVYTPERAFIRYRTKGIRLRARDGLSEKTFRLWHNHLKMLIMHYVNERQDLPALAALAGLFCGILAGEGALEDYGEVTRSPEYRSYMALFERHADPPRDNGVYAPGRRVSAPPLPEVPEARGDADAPEAPFLRHYAGTGRLKGRYGYSGETFRQWLAGLNALILDYSKDQSLSAIAALAGHFCGMMAEGEGEEAARSAEFQKYMAFFAHYADPLRNRK